MLGNEQTSDKGLHKLLRRQLRQFSPDLETQVEQQRFLRSISDAYLESEQELKMVERSLYLTSNELHDRNKALQDQLDELQGTQARLESSVGTLRATFNAMGDAVLVLDVHGNIRHANNQAWVFFKSINATKHWKQLIDVLKDPIELHRALDKLHSDPTQELRGTFNLIDGRTVEYRSQPSEIEGELIGRVWCLSDVTRQKHAEATIQRMAFHDALTGLPNRSLLSDRISHALQIAKRQRSKIALLFLDLDNFKKVNDAEGHKTGDELLRQVSHRLSSCIREQDTLARLGGDEFVMLIESFSQDQILHDICTRALEELDNPFELANKSYYVSGSLGISIYPIDADSSESLLHKADMAMYQAKRKGKNNIQYYNQQLEAKALARIELEQQFREALETEQLTPYFQPKVDIESGEIVGAELLMRWFKKEGSQISPGEFIPIAEESGLINELTRFVITRSCQALQAWHTANRKPLTLSINFSSRDFESPQVIQHLFDCLEYFDFPEGRLVIEVTESLFLENRQQVVSLLNDVKERGVRIALDDFGTGYSSFSYLKDLPLDYLKLDRSFLHNVPDDKKNVAIMQTIIDVGRNMDLQVIAEGIETKPVLDLLLQQGCHLGQGFYFFKPMPLEDFEKTLDEPSTRHCAAS